MDKHLKLLFHESNRIISSTFELIHSDVWTSPVPSISGIRYYVLCFDHFSHFVWVYPLRNKFEVFSKFTHFTSYVKTQFKSTIRSFQCDNGGEYNNAQLHNYFSSNGVEVRFSCPHTSQQNGRSKRMIRTINNTIRTLLFQARISPIYRVEALHTTAHLLNILPSSSIDNQIPFKKLFNKKPSYDHLCTFGCLCFPNINHSFLHKLAPRSTPSLFLGYPTNHKGYCCLDLKTRKIIISRHVVFDESIFPAAENIQNNSASSYHFLETETSPLFNTILETPILPAQPTSDSASQPSQTLPTVVPRPALSTSSRHPMITRSRDGTIKQKAILSLNISTVSPLPKRHLQALYDPKFKPSNG